MTEEVFTDRFCVTQPTPYGVRIRGGRNTHELAERIKPFANRKRLKDVILDMPELRIVDYLLPADTPIDRSLRAELAQAMAELGLEDIDQLDDDALLAAMQAGGVAFSTVRRLIGRAKIEGVSRTRRRRTGRRQGRQGDRVRAPPRSDRRAGRAPQALTRPWSFTAATPMKARDIAIDQFQNDDHRRLIILAIEAAGEVITLHAVAQRDRG